MSKQVIVMRKDLNMRKGKMIAQGAHASLGAILNLAYGYDGRGKDREELTIARDQVKRDYGQAVSDAVFDYLTGASRFTKICVYVNSEQELLDIYNQVKAANLPNALIKDAGLTEFNGVPTLTCLGIGPAKDSEIDKITGKLPLL